MKKILYLLPVILLAASCGGKEEKGTEVDPVEAGITERVAKGVGTMYGSVKSGIKAELSTTIDEFSFHQYNVMDGKTNDSVNIVVKDASMKVVAEVVPGEKAEKLGLHLGVHDLGASFSVAIDGQKMFDTVEYKGIDVDAYLKEGKIYVDTSDAELKAAALGIVNKVIAAEGGFVDEGTKQMVNSMIESFAGKFVIEGVADELVDEITDVLPIYEDIQIPAEAIAEIKTTLDEGLAELAKDEILKDLLKFYTYEDGGFGVAAKLSSEDLFKLTDGEKGTTSSGELTASVRFDKDNRVTEVKAGSTIAANHVDNYESSSYHVDLAIKASVGLKVTYGVSSIAYPDFSSFVAFPMEQIAIYFK